MEEGVIYLVFGDGALLSSDADKQRAIAKAEWFKRAGRAPECEVIAVRGQFVFATDDE